MYGDVPPDAVTVTVDDPPLQRIALDDADIPKTAGSLIEIEPDAVHPFPSVIVYVCGPAPAVNVPVPV